MAETKRGRAPSSREPEATREADDQPLKSAKPCAPADWRAIREAYEGRALTVAQVSVVFGVTTTALYARAAKENWTPRRPSAAKGATSTRGSEATFKPAATNVPRTLRGRVAWRRTMILRLYEAMDRQLAEIEASHAENEAMSATDRERQARQMNVIMRSMEKLSEYDEQEARRTAEAKRNKAKADAATPCDPESWREEIARRITRIRNAWSAEAPTERD